MWGHLQSWCGRPGAAGPPIKGVLTLADEALWCRLTKPVPAGGLLSTLLVADPHSSPRHPVKKEPAEPECLARSHTDIQLLPQQAGMASILATAVINSEYHSHASAPSALSHLLAGPAQSPGTGLQVVLSAQQHEDL